MAKKEPKVYSEWMKVPQGLNRHHRVPKSRGGRGLHNNTIEVDAFLHWCWHKLFKSDTPEEIAEKINAKWIPKNCKLVVKWRS